MQRYTTIVGVVRMRLASFSYEDVQLRYGIGSSTVTRIMKRFGELGLEAPQLESMSPKEVEDLFYPPERRRRKKAPLPDFEAIHARMVALGKNADLALAWQDYKRQNPDGYQLSQFYKLYGQWKEEAGVASSACMPVVRAPGQKMYIDWMGDRPDVLVDPRTGEAAKAHIFVTTLGFSSKVYAEAFADERTASFVAGTVHALSFYGACPSQLVPDNCKTAVAKHTRDELVLSAAYRDLEEYYGVVVVPAPPGKPKGKPTVENGVRQLERLVAHEIGGRRFASLASLNGALAEIVKDVNSRAFANPRDVRRTRDHAFEAFDLPQMGRFHTTPTPPATTGPTCASRTTTTSNGKISI